MRDRHDAAAAPAGRSPQETCRGDLAPCRHSIDSTVCSHVMRNALRCSYRRPSVLPAHRDQGSEPRPSRAAAKKMRRLCNLRAAMPAADARAAAVAAAAERPRPACLPMAAAGSRRWCSWQH